MSFVGRAHFAKMLHCFKVTHMKIVLGFNFCRAGALRIGIMTSTGK